MRTCNLLIPALAAAASLLLAAPAIAFSIVYELESGVEAGFEFSNIYDADPSSPAMGTSLGSLSGTLSFDYDGIDTYALISSSVSLASVTYTFDITGGELHNDGGGFLDFVLAGAGPYAQTATITLLGGAATGPNQVSPTQLRLSGESASAPESLPGGGPGGFPPPDGGLPGPTYMIGINLGASTAAAPMPEPSAGLTFAVGAMLAQAAIRRQRP